MLHQKDYLDCERIISTGFKDILDKIFIEPIKEFVFRDGFILQWGPDEEFKKARFNEPRNNSISMIVYPRYIIRVFIESDCYRLKSVHGKLKLRAGDYR